MPEVRTASADAPGSAAEPQRNLRRFVVRIIGAVVVLASLFFLLPRDRLIAALSGFSTEIWLAGVSVYLCLHLIGIAKWRMLMNAAGAGISFSHTARCYYYGLFGNTFLPSVIGGDIVRAGLAMKISHSRSAVLLGSVADRAIDSLGLALVAGTGALLIPMTLGDNPRNVFWGFAILVFTAVALSAVMFLTLPARRFPFPIRRKLVHIRLALHSLAKQPLKMLLALIAALSLQTAQVVMNFWLGRLALIQNATFLMWLFVWPLAKLAATVPLTQGGIGVREAAQGMLFLPLGVSIEKAVATGLIFQAIVIAGNLLAGMLALVIGRFAKPTARLVTEREPVLNHGHRSGLLGLFTAGGIMFFGVNSLAIAVGTGSVGKAWVDWMAMWPGLDASFAGSLAGIVYVAVPGYLLGRLVGNFSHHRRLHITGTRVG